MQAYNGRNKGDFPTPPPPQHTHTHTHTHTRARARARARRRKQNKLVLFIIRVELISGTIQNNIMVNRTPYASLRVLYGYITDVPYIVSTTRTVFFLFLFYLNSFHISDIRLILQIVIMIATCVSKLHIIITTPRLFLLSFNVKPFHIRDIRLILQISR